MFVNKVECFFIYQIKKFTMRGISMYTKVAIVLSNNYYKMSSDIVNFYIAFINSKFHITSVLDKSKLIKSSLFGHIVGSVFYNACSC